MENKEEKPLNNGRGKPGGLPENLTGKGQSKRTHRRITEREAAFVREYLIDSNGTRSCIAAGYGPKAAHSTAAALLKKPHIIEMLEAGRAEHAKRCEVDADMITKELMSIAFADMNDFIVLENTPDGKGGIIQTLQFKPTSAFTAGHGKIIKSFKVGRGGRIELQLNDKMSAIDMLARRINYFEKDNKSKGVAAVGIYVPDNGRGDVYQEPTDEELKKRDNQ